MLSETLQTLHEQHRERRLRIATRAVHDTPINLKIKKGFYPQERKLPQPDIIENVWDVIPSLVHDWLLVSSPSFERLDKLPSDIIHRIKRIVATDFKVKIQVLESHRRSEDYIKPRFTAIYLCKTLTIKSYPEIAKQFGGRDHTTIIHAFRKAEKRIAADLVYRQRVSRIQAQVEQEITNWRLHW